VVYHHHGRRGKLAARKLNSYYDKSRGAYYAKMVLGKSSRSTYLRIIKRKVVEDFRAARTFPEWQSVFARVARELFGAVQYLFFIAKHPSRVPAP
jgi:hypothetical protein